MFSNFKMCLLLLVIALTYLFYRYFVFFTYWSRRNVPSLKPLPLFGNIQLSMRYKRSFFEDVQEIYNTFPDKRYVGLHLKESPHLMIRDLNILKDILVKEFDTFPEHQKYFPDNVDPLWDNNLFSMKGKKHWLYLRTLLSPFFTSGKLKIMFYLMQDGAKQFSEYLSSNCSNQILNLEMKSTFTKYTNDVIATSAFGITCNTIDDENNEFYQNCLNLTNLFDSGNLKLILFTMIPYAIKFLRVSVFPKSNAKFFSDAIKKSIKFRKENNIVRPDMINLLLHAQSKSLQNVNTETLEITDEIIVAQAVIFTVAGFLSTSTNLAQVAYELAVNPNIQERLRQEIDEICDFGDQTLTYDKLNEMTYLDMVFSETLRKWPPDVFTDRKVVKPFTIKPTAANEKPVYLHPNDKILIPTACIQRDPNYYPEPDKFDPERFSKSNEHNIKPFSYLPFGAGPRNCIGSRFAILTAKTVIVEILRKFELVPIKKTTIPMEMGKQNFSTLAEEGIWLGIKRRS